MDEPNGLNPRQSPEEMARLRERLTPHSTQRTFNVRLMNRASDSSRDSWMLILALLSFVLPGGFLIAIFPATSGRGATQALGIISACVNLSATILIWSTRR